MYKDLLTAERMRTSTRGTLSLYEEVESDRARVLYSSAFRRLQRKTQVFPLEENAAIRTRLTHSLEVAHVGRYLASRVLDRLDITGQRQAFGLKGETGHAFSVMVEVACLLHDIGNPPFGHFGEVAISEWFREQDSKGLFSELGNFDGNPQGFRIITRLGGKPAKNGMNLLVSQLASTLKYQSALTEKKAFKKYGAFASERSELLKIRSTLRLGPEQRFCLAYLMEAADDISYCLSDIEDGIEKGVIEFDSFVTKLEAELRGPGGAVLEKGLAATRTDESDVEKVVAFRAAVIRHLVAAAADRYVSGHADVLDGRCMELISESTAEGEFLEAVKGLVRRQVYDCDAIVRLELGGLSVIKGLLEIFGKVLLCKRSDFVKLVNRERVKGCDKERRITSLFGRSQKAVYIAETKTCTDDIEMRARAQLIVDYISGMTDPFAQEMFRRLRGIQG